MNSLEEEIANNLANEIRQGIDNELLADMLVACGWYRVRLSNLKSSDEKIVDAWTRENCAGKFQHFAYTWLFEDQADAVLFSLKWV